MAKNLDKLPVQFKELADVLNGAKRAGWSIGSAEGGWATPSKEEWGKQDEGDAEKAPRTRAARRRAAARDKRAAG